MVVQNRSQHPMKVLFLDFDEVFWTKRTRLSDYDYADPVVVSFISYICNHYGYTIVDISSNRCLYNDIENFKGHITIHGCGQLCEFVDKNHKTTDINMGCQSLEIEDWLSEFRIEHQGKEPKVMVITVDDKMGTVSRFVRNTVTMENPKNGMGVLEFQRCLNIVERQSQD